MAKRRKKIAERRAHKKAQKAAGLTPSGSSKYAERKRMRQNGHPMASRPVAPWWARLPSVMRPEPAFEPSLKAA